jgi:hypothetical protein
MTNTCLRHFHFFSFFIQLSHMSAIIMIDIMQGNMCKIFLEQIFCHCLKLFLLFLSGVHANLE